MDLENEVSYLPATGASKLHQLANLFLGWGLDFIVVTDDDKQGRKVYNILKKNLFGDDEKKAKKKLIKLKNYKGIEDVFTKGDFKKYIINSESVQFDGKNSEYLKENKESKGVLALNFMLKVEKKEIKKDDLATTTQRQINEILAKIYNLIT